MLRRIRSFVLIVIAAIIGAVGGRAAAQMRERYDAGLPIAIDPAALRPGPQDIVPGIVAAFRVGEAPWSWLHIPGWLAAFAVNFGAAVLAGDLQHLRDMFDGGRREPDPWRDESAAGDYVDGDASATWDAEAQPDPTA